MIARKHSKKKKIENLWLSNSEPYTFIKGKPHPCGIADYQLGTFLEVYGNQRKPYIIATKIKYGTDATPNTLCFNLLDWFINNKTQSGKNHYFIADSAFCGQQVLDFCINKGIDFTVSASKCSTFPKVILCAHPLNYGEYVGAKCDKIRYYNVHDPEQDRSIKLAHYTSKPYSTPSSESYLAFPARFTAEEVQPLKKLPAALLYKLTRNKTQNVTKAIKILTGVNSEEEVISRNELFRLIDKSKSTNYAGIPPRNIHRVKRYIEASTTPHLKSLYQSISSNNSRESKRTKLKVLIFMKLLNGAALINRIDDSIKVHHDSNGMVLSRIYRGYFGAIDVHNHLLYNGGLPQKLLNWSALGALSMLFSSLVNIYSLYLHKNKGMNPENYTYSNFLADVMRVLYPEIPEIAGTQ